MRVQNITWLIAVVFIALVVGTSAPSIAQEKTEDDKQKHKTLFLPLQPSHESASFLQTSIQGSSDLATLAAVESIKAHKSEIAKCLPKNSDDGKAGSVAKVSLARVGSLHLRFLSVESGASPAETVQCLTPVLKELALVLPDWMSVRPNQFKNARAGLVLRIVDEDPAAKSANATTKEKEKVDTDALAALVRSADSKQVKQVLMSLHTPLRSLKYCYERGLKEDAKLAGRVRLTAVHSENGKTSAVEINESTLDDDAVETCMVNVLNQIQLGKLEADVAALTIEVQFAPK